MSALPNVILNFHGLGDPHAGVEPGERPYWLPLEDFARVLDRIAADPDPSRIVLTFDDGNASDLEAAALLAGRGMAGRFYVLAGRIGHRHYLSAADLRSLVAMGMTVGLHGRAHNRWPTLDDANLVDETVRARSDIALAAGCPIDEVAIPFGAYDRRVFGWLERQDFRRILTSDRGPFDPAARVWNRNTVRADMTAAQIEAILAGRLGWTERVRLAVSQFLRRRVR
jgi:peptidoglycan/xylan/chitin deacetylase (PgdA/CDA1 family)